MSDDKIWSRFARVFEVASLISDRGERGCTLYEIMDLIGCRNRSSAFNVLQTLDDLGFAYYSEKADDGSRKVLYKIGNEESARWKNRIMSSVLSDDDIRFLTFVLESVSASSPLMDLCGDDFISRLRMAVSPERGRSLRPELVRYGSYFKVPHEYFRTLLILLEASQKHIRCHVVYESRNSESTVEFDVFPLRVTVKEGGVYAEALNTFGQRRLLALSRIVKLTKLRHEKYPAEADAPGFEDPFPFYRNEDAFDAEILIDANQAWYEMQKAWPASVSFEEQEDGAFLFRLRTSSTYGLSRWILSMGQSASVLKPDWLRDQMADELESMLAKYKRR